VTLSSELLKHLQFWKLGRQDFKKNKFLAFHVG